MIPFSVHVANTLDSFIATLLFTGLATTPFVLSRRRVRRVWGIKIRELLDNRTVHCAVASVSDNSYKQRKTIGGGELKAVAILTQSLSSISVFGRSRDLNVNFSSDFTSWTDDIVALGGTKYNEVTKSILAEYESNFAVRSNADGTVIFDQVGQRTYTPDLTSGERRDYAIVYRLPNPWNDQKFAIVIRGLHTFGVSGASELFSRARAKELESSLKSLGSPLYWEILVEVRVLGSVGTEIPSVIGGQSIRTGQPLR